jgi:putative membrane protein
MHMRSTALLGKLPPLACALALAAGFGCTTSTAAGGAGPGQGGTGADGGGMTSADGGMAGGTGGVGSATTGGVAGGSRRESGTSDGGSSVAHDVGAGAGTAAGEVAAGAQAAGRGIADAGAAAVGAVKEAAVSAAEAAKEAVAGPKISDAQIAAVAVAANDVDIAAARMAKKQTKNAKVKEFANLMIKDHTSVNKQAGALVKKLGVTPQENDTSRALSKGGDENIAHLKKLKGKEFDRAYAQHEVDYHQQVLSALNDTLIPNARNAELKGLLEKVAPVVQEHLDHAKSMVSDLGQ